MSVLGLVDHPTLSACADPPPAARRNRLAFWRSPEGQPAWARPALLAIAAAAAVLFAWNIADAGFAPFYSVAVRSMSESWKAFFYGAFDPKATVTIDKLAGSFLPQALSARLFGFHPWSLALPQVVEGVVSVLVMYRVVRRWAGVTPGLLAAGVFAFTPIAASMFGHSMEDGALTMCLVLAADSWQRAMVDARARSLIASGVWVGFGFQAKMLQAWMILPALGLGYLIAAPALLRKRVAHLSVAGAVMLAVSLSWIALYTVTPAKSRPYVDGSTNNSVVAMVFGYNGLERFGIRVPGAVTSGPGVTVQAGSGSGGAPSGSGLPGGLAGRGGASGAGGGGQSGASGYGSARASGSGTAVGSGGAPRAGTVYLYGRSGPSAAGRLAHPGSGGGDSSGWTKLLGGGFGAEIGWLYPLALLALAAGLVSRRRAGRSDPARAGLVMWGIWLATFGLVYSEMGNLPHTAYVASLAPPLAALSGAGIVMFWRWYRAGERRGWLLPAAVVAELAWAAHLWSDYGTFLPWALWAAVAAGSAAVIVLVAARLGRRPGTRRVLAGMAAAVAAMLAAPATWAASVLDVNYAGSSFDASAGPAGGFGAGPGSARMALAPLGSLRFRTPTGSGGAGRPGAASGFPGGPGIGSSVRGGASGYPGGAGLAGRPGGGAGGGIQASATTTLTSAEKRIYDYVTAHGHSASYLMAVQSWSEASPYILATGREVLPLGGFSGTVPEPTLAQVQQLVRSGQLRFFLLNGDGRAGSGQGPGGGGVAEREKIISWVERACRVVPAKAYSAASPGSGPSGGRSAIVGSGSFRSAFGEAGQGSGTLYECGADG